MILRIAIPSLLAIGSSASAEAPPLERVLAGLADKGEFSGAVAIMRDDRLVYSKGFGLADATRKLPFEPDTIVDTGSVAKPVTAAAVLLLAQEGRLDLDSPVRRYVAEYPHEKTRIRQLLMHSGGLPDYGAFDAELTSGKVIRTIDLLALVRGKQAEPAFGPGARFSYCNICYDTLALVVERVAKEPYFSFVRRRLLAPAGASRAFLRPARFSDWKGTRIAGYLRKDGGVEANDAFDNEGFYGGSNIYFSAVDLAAWASAWARSHPALRPVQATATKSVDFPDGRSGLSLGNWYCSRSGLQCYYPGHHQGFHAFGYWDARRRIAVAFVSNGTLSPPLQTSVPRLLIQAAEGRPLEPAAEDFSKPLDVEPGTYAVEGIGWVVASGEGTRRRVRPPGRTSYDLLPIGSGWLYAPGLDVYLRRGADRPDRLIWRSVFDRTSGRRVGPG